MCGSLELTLGKRKYWEIAIRLGRLKNVIHRVEVFGLVHGSAIS